MLMPILPRIIMRHSTLLKLFYLLNRTVPEAVEVNPLMKLSKNWQIKSSLISPRPLMLKPLKRSIL